MKQEPVSVYPLTLDPSVPVYSQFEEESLTRRRQATADENQQAGKPALRLFSQERKHEEF